MYKPSAISIYLFVLLCFTYSGKMKAQIQIDSFLAIQNMGEKDLQFTENNTFNQQIVSASKSLKDIKDLPFTIHVITKEEIIKNGYITLVDALKMVPGIRISQPGSALEGETFLMRGLKGNAYTKILINGVNFKPSVVSGMPIGAQLPIQQAERIEIIYGPVAALYGADASAGVINIILKNTERPIYTQAGLVLGRDDYSALNLMFGGRLGKGSKTLDFSVYANNTTYQDRRIIHKKDTKLFNPPHYAFDFDLKSSPNYISSGVDSVALIGKLPHSSRLVGFQLRYKSMSLSFNNMYRRDHSAIGLNPSAVSYANPLNYIGERLVNLNFNIDKQFKKWSFKTELNYLGFKMDNLSSTTYILNTFSFALTDLASWTSFSTPPVGEVDPIVVDSLTQSGLNTFIKGNRYSYASSRNAQVSQSFNFYPLDFFELSAGLTFNSFFNTPLTEYSPIPFNEFNSNSAIDTFQKSFVIPFDLASTVDYDFSGYLQSYLTLKKLHFIAGAQYYYHSNYGKAINPRIAILYKLFPNLRLRGFYGTAFRRPPQFYEDNNYLLGLNGVVNRFRRRLTPERTRSFELGLRWDNTKKVYWDMVFFHTSTKNLLSFDVKPIFNQLQNMVLGYDIGYANFGKATSSLYGIQSSLLFKNIIEKIKFNSRLHIQWAKVKENIDENSLFKGNVSEQPRLMIQSRTSFFMSKNISLTFDGIYMGNFRNKKFNDEKFINRKYFTLDILAFFQLNKNFNVSLKVNNLFNKEYAGIDASGTTDDLIYNPQQKRFFRLGLNYLLD